MIELFKSDEYPERKQLSQEIFLFESEDENCIEGLDKSLFVMLIPSKSQFVKNDNFGVK